MQISVTVLEIYEFEIYILASEAKFDLGGQKSFQEKLADFIKKEARKRIMQISVTVLEINELIIYILASEAKCDLGGQKSFQEKLADCIKKEARKKNYVDICNGSGDK